MKIPSTKIFCNIYKERQLKEKQSIFKTIQEWEQQNYKFITKTKKENSNACYY